MTESPLKPQVASLPVSNQVDPPLEMFATASGLVPEVPSRLEDLGLDDELLSDLTLKLAYTVPHLTTARAVRELGLPFGMISTILDQLVKDKLLEILGQVGPFNYRFTITNAGREHARRVMEVCAYVGPAPVSADDYKQMTTWSIGSFPELSADRIRASITDLVLPDGATHVIGLAASSGRSLLLWGPPGNGKTSVGRMLHRAMPGTLWIPHCVAVESRVIHVFDPRFHSTNSPDLTPDEEGRVDRRWIRIDRPHIIAGGELKLEDLDLAFDPALGTYQAPLHLKANGGIFLLDDFGTQSVDPHTLLNRWIIPLEYHVDYLTLLTGQKLEVAFQQMLIISTNQDPGVVMTPALLRRMGYRLYLDHPTPEMYMRIFEDYTAKLGLVIPPDMIQNLLARYRSEQRPLAGCEPSDLIDRCCDICRFEGMEPKLTNELMDLAWRGYFGN